MVANSGKWRRKNSSEEGYYIQNIDISQSVVIFNKEQILTINSNLAITISVSSFQESLCLCISEGPGSSREILQEQSEEHIRQLPLSVLFKEVYLKVLKQMYLIWTGVLRPDLLELILLNEAALVLVNDKEGLLDVIRTLSRQTNLGEEALVVEGFSSWKVISSRFFYDGGDEWLREERKGLEKHPQAHTLTTNDVYTEVDTLEWKSCHYLLTRIVLNPRDFLFSVEHRRRC